MRQSNKSSTEGQTNKKSQNIKDKIRQQEDVNMSKPQEEIAALKNVIEWGQKLKEGEKTNVERGWENKTKKN